MSRIPHAGAGAVTRDPRGVDVRGGASAEDLAAVLAVVAGRGRPAIEQPLARWRRLRQAVTRSTDG